MEELILDSGALIALERGDLDPSAVIPGGAIVAISAVTAAELMVGVELADSTHRDRREAFVTDLLDNVEVVAYDLAIAR